MKIKIRTSFFIITLCWNVLCFGQETIKTTRFGISVTPQLNTTIFKDKEEIKEWKSTIGLAAAGNFHFDLSPKAQLVTGLEFQYIKYSYKDYSGTWPDEIDSNFIINDLNYFNYQYSLFFIGLPVQMKLKLNSPEKLNHFFLITGITLRYRFTTAGEVSLVEEGTTTINRNIDEWFWAPDKFWFLGSVGFGYEMKCENHKLSIAPTFEYSPGQLYNDHGSAIADAHPAFFGICFSYY